LNEINDIEGEEEAENNGPGNGTINNMSMS
jgi:hypothetical protein